MLREARAAAALDHPNVVAIFDVGEVGETPYIAMELVEGVTLREYIGDKRVSRKRRVTWMIEIARALGAAHGRGVVHRDVKPENVMVRSDGALKVLDFGIARRLREGGSDGAGEHSSTVTRDSAPIGTLLYMAPEQLEGARVDARCDQFAWGVLALELFRGEHPWGPLTTPVALVEAILHAEAPPLEPGADVPAAFVSAVARATAKKPAERFPSMDAMVGGLGGDERLPVARPPTGAALAAASTSGPVTLDEPSAPRTPFAAGDVIAGRYEIVRLLGRGGMGEVYEATDGSGGGRVALKTVRADRSRDRRLLDRFAREVELARRVVHPNVVRVLDVCRHASADDVEPALVLAMELLEGESLAALLRRRGALSTDEARPLVQQMASALAAAHAAGVVHRDFKSANVFLETTVAGKTRAVVTDFGLSRAITPGEGDPKLSRDVLLLGTPAYMAPEQIAGGQLDARADIYAFGVVLFELVTGRLPFDGETPAASAMMRLSQRPPAPSSASSRASTLRGTRRSFDASRARRRIASRAPARSSTRSPRARDREHGEGRRSARSSAERCWPVLSPAVTPGARQRYARRDPRDADERRTASDAAFPTPTVRRSVAVWTLLNASGDPRTAWLSSALGEMLRTELSAGEALRVVPGASVGRTQRDLAVPDVGDLSRADAARAATSMGASVLIDGAYVAVGAEGQRRLRVDLHAKDATGEMLASVAETGTEDQLFELVERAAAEVRAAIHAPAAEAPSVHMARASLPAGAAASREYGEGALAMQSLDFTAARAHFEKAVALDPAAPLPHAKLSAALIAVGYVSRAADEAKAALDRASEVSREDRLVIEAQYLECTYDRAGSVDRWHALFGFFPDNVEYGLSLARAYLKASQPPRALEVIDALRKHPPPVDQDPRHHILAARAVARSYFQALDRIAQAALAKAKAIGSRSLATEAEVLSANASGDLGRLQGLADDYQRIEREYDELGNRRGAIFSNVSRAQVYERLNDLRTANQEASRAVEAAKALGYPKSRRRRSFATRKCSAAQTVARPVSTSIERWGSRNRSAIDTPRWPC